MKQEGTRSGPPLWILAALLVVVAVAWQLMAYYRQQQYHQMRAGLGQLQMEIEAYAVQTEGSYPSDLAAFIKSRKLQLPRNPFGQGQVRILQTGDHWVPGGILYMPFGPIVAAGKASGSEPPIVPTDNDQYVLLAYSPRVHHGAQPKVDMHGVDLARKLGNIDWEHVEFLLTAGEDYSP